VGLSFWRRKCGLDHSVVTTVPPQMRHAGLWYKEERPRRQRDLNPTRSSMTSKFRPASEASPRSLVEPLQTPRAQGEA